ncbi:hypothetical protein HA075_19715 [bacterium BFN5]|nr:hypothetical protein HA075_19715 [bacterium BFN5]
MAAHAHDSNQPSRSSNPRRPEEQLEKLEQEAVRKRDLNTKMYRYLGVCSGLVVVILLV